ncbi:uncharacterized protein LOC144226920 [Crocuta crocuta]
MSEKNQDGFNSIMEEGRIEQNHSCWQGEACRHINSSEGDAGQDTERDVTLRLTQASLRNSKRRPHMNESFNHPQLYWRKISRRWGVEIKVLIYTGSGSFMNYEWIMFFTDLQILSIIII